MPFFQVLFCPNTTKEAWIEHEYTKSRVPGIPLIASVGYSASDMLQLVPKVDPFVDGFEFSCHYTALAEITALAQALRKVRSAKTPNILTSSFLEHKKTNFRQTITTRP